uniref:CBF1-interacting co-repressor CIR N-terminal domain-containing protein n=1 Tax=Panagrolaimus sp. ES5 TaxID=591445 RepID=A0AC34FAC7_9BILA
MGKGFQNFMSKKDFHPSAWWNLKKVFEAKEKIKLNDQKQEELRIQHEKEQEIMSSKALLGDEKAKLGLSFMYDAPTGMTKREEPKEEPKFEWQRKYNAPREEWAKGNDAIQDQPFAIQVRNVRCVKCHTWGHLNTDRECPLYGMSGNAENPGYANNPSDLLKEFRDEKKKDEEKKKSDDSSDSEDEYEEVKHEPVDQVQLLSDMKEDHGFNFKKNILHNIRSDDVLKTLGAPKDDPDDVHSFLKNINPSRRKAILARVFGKGSKEYKAEKAKQKADKQAEKKAKEAAKKAKEESPDYGNTARYEKSSRDTKSRRYDDERSTRDTKRKYDDSERSSRDAKRRRYDDESERKTKYDKDRSSRHERSSKYESSSSSRREKSDRYDKNDKRDKKRRRSRSRS